MRIVVVSIYFSTMRCGIIDFNKCVLNLLFGFAQNAKSNMVAYLFTVLNGTGVARVSGELADRSLYPGGLKRLRGVTTERGFQALTGMDKWFLMAIALLVFRPVLASVQSLVRIISHECSLATRLVEIRKPVALRSRPRINPLIYQVTIWG